jgi:predicted acyl esterase
VSAAVVKMRIDYDVPIPMDDGLELRADIFRPDEPGRYPVILTHGPYGKGYHFADRSVRAWEELQRDHPEIFRGTSGRYLNWETPDPEKWVPDGFVCVRVDSRGAGRSPGYLDILSPRETQDYYGCIEWAGVQPWSNGNVGLLGISYYAMNQWQVAALRPPHLKAMAPWEGGVDHYRDFCRQGGIYTSFVSSWYAKSILGVQHGLGERGPVDRNTGEYVAGPESLPAEELEKNREPHDREVVGRPLDGEYYRARTADIAQITVPCLSAANWSHQLHSRGNFEAFQQLPEGRRWLEVHGLEHFTSFYTDAGVALQKRFFGHFLAGQDTGWESEPPVSLQVRTVDDEFVPRAESSWPLAGTQWREFFLNTETMSLDPEAPERPGTVDFEALSPGVTFRSAPMSTETEIIGPASARLYVASSTTDADVFLALRIFDPDGQDVTFRSAIDPRGIAGYGWLRASHRKLDEARSLPHRPWHTHDEPWPLVPGETVQCDVEIWPICMVLPPGYRFALTVLGRDFELPGEGPWPEMAGVRMRGAGVFLHEDADDRPGEVFAGRTTLSGGSEAASHLLLPFVP